MRDLANIMGVYAGSDGDAMRALYEDLGKLGPHGMVAVNLFRACKCSERAKVYRRGPGHKTEAYRRKDWSIKNLAETLTKQADLLPEIPGTLTERIAWGWQIDEGMRAKEDPHHHVVYVDLPTGQVSFHNGARYDGPDYAKPWDGAAGTAPDRI